MIKKQKQEEFRDLRFGMFIHFGLYALGKEHEWHMYKHKMSHDQYKDKFMANFDPDPKGMEQWVITAKNMGAKYIVLTSKHHDGFCLWDTKVPHDVDPEYHIRNTPFFKKNKKGVVDYLFEAGKKHGIRIGLYHSTIDWSWTQGEKKWLRPQPHLNFKNKELNAKYVKYYQAQVMELAELYPDLLLLWFDGYQFKNKTHPNGFLKYLDYKGLYQNMQEKHPEVLMGNNSGTTGGEGEMGNTDFLLFENTTRACGINGAPWPRKSDLPGEVCLTLNKAWGYNEKDKNFKNPEDIQGLVLDGILKNSNLLFNFGPKADGFIADDHVDVSKKIGELVRPYEFLYKTRSVSVEDWGGIISEKINEGQSNRYVLITNPDKFPKSGYAPSFDYLSENFKFIIPNVSDSKISIGENNSIKIENAVKNSVIKIN